MTKKDLKQIAETFHIGDNAERRKLNDKRYEDLFDQLDRIENNHLTTIEGELEEIRRMLID